MKKAIWIFALVSLLFVGMLPTVEAPTWEDGTWDILYNVRGSYPETEGWTHTSNLLTSRSTVYHDQILNVTLGGSNAYDRYTHTFSSTEFTAIEARVKIPTDNSQINLYVNLPVDYGTTLSVITGSGYINTGYRNPSGYWSMESHYEDNIIGSNHTYTLLSWEDGGTRKINAYYDGNLIVNQSFNRFDVSGFVNATFECQSVAAVASYCEWDYVALRTTSLSSKLDEIDDLKKELEELRKKLDDVHSGEIIDPTEKLLPYPPGTREGLDADYYLLGDPYRELFFNSYSDPDASGSVTLPILYDTSWSDVDMLTDQMWIGDFAGTLYINDTTDSTKILETTQSYSHFLVNDTSEGHALTVEVTSGSVKVSRMARTHATFTFDWYIDPHTYEHRTVFSVDNDLTENWREIVIVVAGNPDYTIDSSSVEVWDLDNNVELTTKNYEMTSTSFRMGLTWLNSSTSRSFKILYSPYQEGSSYQEPMGVFRYDVASSATLNNRVFLFDSVAISNPNSIDCDVGTRITIQMSSIPGNINEIFVITAGGSYLTQGPHLGGKWYTFYGLEIPASSVVTVSVYVKAPEPTLSPGWFQLHGLWIFALFFIMLIISFLGWMWAVTVKGMHKYAGPIAAFFWFNVLMTMLFGVLTFLAGG